MTGWTTPDRSWPSPVRLFSIAVLVGTAWLTRTWSGSAAWVAPLAVLALGLGACHALVVDVRALARQQHRRAAIEAGLCVLFVVAAGFAIGLAADTSSPC